MIRLAIVDDHPVARRGIESILNEAPDIAVTMSVGSPADLPGAGSCGQALPDVVLLDLYISSQEPCLPAVSALRAATRVLIFSAFGRPADVLGAIRAGASGYITKLADDQVLVSAVRTVASGGFALSSELADILLAELPPQQGAAGIEPGADSRRAGLLSPRERQALDLIAGGFTHAQTAHRMGVSKATIDTYVGRIRAKLQVGNKAELTRAALQWVTADQEQRGTAGQAR
jgi:DNA-binding NarL/FixJ family response regulator